MAISPVEQGRSAFGFTGYGSNVGLSLVVLFGAHSE